MASVVSPGHLLLLARPRSASSDDISASCRTALVTVLTDISDQIHHGTVGACLDIALPLSSVCEHGNKPRGQIYDHVQGVVAGIYKLIGFVAAERKINVEDNEGIDVRVVLLAVDDHGKVAPKRDEGKTIDLPKETSTGPVISLRALACCKRRWQSVFAIEGDEGDQILHDFLVPQNTHINVKRVSSSAPSGASFHANIRSDKTAFHTSIAVGGTWDHIHIGHKLLLTMFAFMLQYAEDKESSLIVGITGDELLKNKKYAEVLESWQDRQRSVIRFLKAIIDFRPLPEPVVSSRELNDPGPNGHAVHYNISDKLIIKLVEIGDPFGPTITDESISALILSAETRTGGKSVNEKREAQGWQPLYVYEVEVLDASEGRSNDADNSSFASKLSSTHIRKSIVERGRARSKA